MDKFSGRASAQASLLPYYDHESRQKFVLHSKTDFHEETKAWGDEGGLLKTKMLFYYSVTYDRQSKKKT